MPAAWSTPTRHRSAIRVALAALGLLQLFDGAYALLAPVSFYEDFPLGRGWVEALPAYNEHLVRDVGGLFLATSLVLLVAAWTLERRLIQVAAASFLLFSIPHTLYHYLNLGPYSTVDAVGNALGLAATVLVPIWVLWAVRGASTERGAELALAPETDTPRPSETARGVPPPGRGETP